MSGVKPILIYFVTVDWFFCSHFLSRAIAAKEAGFDVKVLTHFDHHKKIIKDAGFELIDLQISRRSLNPLSALIQLLQIIKVFRQHRPDLIHHVALKPILLGGLAARFICQRNIVNAIVGGGYVFSSAKVSTFVLRQLLIFAFRYLLNPVGSRVIFENHDDLNFFVNKGLVSRSDVVLIRGAGVNLSDFSSGIERQHPPIVILVARLLWDKGINEFVEAAKFLKLSGAIARFVIVGDFDNENRACIDRGTIDRWTNEGFVEFWGYRDDVPKLLSTASIACLPSYREGLPKFLLEAMAAGLPCVTTDVPGCREVVCDGDNGFLIPVRDPMALVGAIQHLLHDPKLAQHMGARGRALVEKYFSESHVNEQTIDLYREMLNASLMPTK